MKNVLLIKKVFLLADIGTGKNKSYHVGDEAMFLQNLRRYQSVAIKVSASSRSISHQGLGFKEVLDIYITNILMLFYLVFCVYVLRFFKLNLFPEFFRKTAQELVSSDLLHVAGGGNLNSLWPGHIYYRFLMITLAAAFNKEIILTSQTIGPITTKFHEFLLSHCLKKVKIIEIRDFAYSRDVLINLRVNKSKIRTVIDDAYDFKVKTDKKTNQRIFDKFPHDNRKMKIGISMHEWPTSKHFQVIKQVFIRLMQNYPNAYFFSIPHNFDDKDGLDTKFMARLIGRDKKRVGLFDYKIIESLAKETKLTSAEIIKLITANMDFVISSRYHGLVFALSSNVPVLAINYDKYYSVKNNGLLDNFFENVEGYTVSISEIENALDKAKKIIDNRKIIAIELKAKNKKLISKYENKFYQSN